MRGALTIRHSKPFCDETKNKRNIHSRDKGFILWACRGPSARHTSYYDMASGERQPKIAVCLRQQGEITCHPETPAGQVAEGSPDCAGAMDECLGHSARLLGGHQHVHVTHSPWALRSPGSSLSPLEDCFSFWRGQL